LQPPPQLAFKLPPRLLELASLQPWCHGNKQRLRLLCCCRPLSTLAMRLARESAKAAAACSGARLRASWRAASPSVPCSFEHAGLHPLLYFHTRSEMFLLRRMMLWWQMFGACPIDNKVQ
jgi:hypothetical protein